MVSERTSLSTVWFGDEPSGSWWAFSRGNRNFTVDGGRLRQSGPRPDTRLLRQPALEVLTRSARTDSPRQVGRKKFRRLEAAAALGGGFREEGAAATFRVRV
ncbi:hypothetical protein F511_21534 [Dorcoceras hygrometricum]|uniref:Uncharacterized protein n=1 Tax=Dorcoceras hygrometricum TaxID=472368 RepID=A0A2Z7D1E9_9LAMI|nr:hypothetical protein F511_21534 [Dorcoceras hygrometricum]